MQIESIAQRSWTSLVATDDTGRLIVFELQQRFMIIDNVLNLCLVCMMSLESLEPGREITDLIQIHIVQDVTKML